MNQSNYYKRRQFLKTLAVLTAASSVTPLLQGCGDSASTADSPSTTAATSPGTTITSSSNTPTARTAGKAADEKVIIIGAGIAGLAAGRYLKSQGIPSVILEARNRIGGRIWTDTSLGYPLDLGASWIHGIDKNPITQLAQDFKIKTVTTDFDAVVLFDRNGAEISDSTYSQIDSTVKTVMKKVEALKENAAVSDSMDTALKQILPTLNLQGQLERGVNWELASEIQLEYGVDLSDMTLRYWDVDLAFDGDDVLFPDGYIQIANGVAQGLDIKTGQIVTKIEYEDNKGVTVTTNQGQFSGSRVIVTLPLGVLQKGDVAFAPALPADKQKSIQNLHMGTLDKIMLKFPQAFWPEKAQFFGYIDGTAGQEFEFWNAQYYTGKPVLMALVAGSHAYALEQMSKDNIVAAAMSDLKNAFGSSIPDPVDMVMAKWHSDNFAYGTYSHIAPGASGDDYDTMSSAVGSRLFFAGEATSRDYPGTVHGAFMSGEREAKKIAKLVTVGS